MSGELYTYADMVMEKTPDENCDLMVNCLSDAAELAAPIASHGRLTEADAAAIARLREIMANLTKLLDDCAERPA